MKRNPTLLLARHGETAENASGRMLGRRDPPLSGIGRSQAERLAEALRSVPVAAIWSSPLRRARETAGIVAAALDLDLRILDELAESDRGSWEGAAHADLQRASPGLYARFLAADPAFAFPGGESLRAQRDRTRRGLALIAAGPLPALVVAHAGTIRSALALWQRDVPPESALAHGEVAATLDHPSPGA